MRSQKKRGVGWGDSSIGAKGKPRAVEDDLDIGLDDESQEAEAQEPVVDDEFDDLFDDDPPEKPKPAAKPVRRITKKTAPEPVEEEPEEEPEEDLFDETPPPRVSESTTSSPQEGVVLECPVCRDLTGTCSCEEEDRTFQRRVRFENDVKRVGRCPRCQAPLSVLYLPRPGAQAPFRLTQFSSVWMCLACQPDSIATLAVRVERARPRT